MSTPDSDLSLTVRVDQTRCIGSGNCVATAPDHLALGRGGRAFPTHPTSTAREQLSDAAEMCLVEAITVHLAATGEQIAPLD